MICSNTQGNNVGESNTLPLTHCVSYNIILKAIYPFKQVYVFHKNDQINILYFPFENRFKLMIIIMISNVYLSHLMCNAVSLVGLVSP